MHVDGGCASGWGWARIGAVHMDGWWAVHMDGCRLKVGLGMESTGEHGQSAEAGGEDAVQRGAEFHTGLCAREACCL